jgi:hypothetical protein
MLISYRDESGNTTNIQNLTAYSFLYKTRHPLKKIQSHLDNFIVLSNTALNDLYNRNKKSAQKPQPQNPPEPEPQQRKRKRYA